jgi:hypothetical protein
VTFLQKYELPKDKEVKNPEKSLTEGAAQDTHTAVQDLINEIKSLRETINS